MILIHLKHLGMFYLAKNRKLIFLMLKKISSNILIYIILLNSQKHFEASR